MELLLSVVVFLLWLGCCLFKKISSLFFGFCLFFPLIHILSLFIHKSSKNFILYTGIFLSVDEIGLMSYTRYCTLILWLKIVLWNILKANGIYLSFCNCLRFCMVCMSHNFIRYNFIYYCFSSIADLSSLQWDFS